MLSGTSCWWKQTPVAKDTICEFLLQLPVPAVVGVVAAGVRTTGGGTISGVGGGCPASCDEGVEVCPGSCEVESAELDCAGEAMLKCSGMPPGLTKALSCVGGSGERRGLTSRDLGGAPVVISDLSSEIWLSTSAMSCALSASSASVASRIWPACGLMRIMSATKCTCSGLRYG